GATIMGRNMFGGGPGAWDESWKGWWGDNPPFHHPVFVLTSHPREPLEMQGGTTFHFVTHGIEPALEHARAAGGEKEVSLGGGAPGAQQYLAAGLLDELVVSVVPLLLGGGAAGRRRAVPVRDRRGRLHGHALRARRHGDADRRAGDGPGRAGARGVHAGRRHRARLAHGAGQRGVRRRGRHSGEWGRGGR